MRKAGLSRRSSMSGLKATPRQATLISLRWFPCLEFLDRLLNLGENPVRLAVVDCSCGADQPCLFRCAINNKPGVNGNAVAANTGTRLEDIDSGMAVGKLDHFPDVDI